VCYSKEAFSIKRCYWFCTADFRNMVSHSSIWWWLSMMIIDHHLDEISRREEDIFDKSLQKSFEWVFVLTVILVWRIMFANSGEGWCLDPFHTEYANLTISLFVWLANHRFLFNVYKTSKLEDPYLLDKLFRVYSVLQTIDKVISTLFLRSTLFFSMLSLLLYNAAKFCPFPQIGKDSPSAVSVRVEFRKDTQMC